MAKIKILNKGLLTSIQDLGRKGYQEYGVPISGVMDEYSHKIANILVNNKLNEATIEVTMIGPKIKFLDNQMIAITGGGLLPQINGKKVKMWKNLLVKEGDILSFSGLNKGLRSYISFAGGIDIPLVMGSKSFYKRAMIGTEIKNNHIINLKQSNFRQQRKLIKKYIPKYKKDITCRVILGPQDNLFSKKGINDLFSSKYKISNDFHRMGIRLDGKNIEHKNSADIISDGLGKGAIQVPGNGRPIIMMSDSQTTGGYTKIGYVIKKDLNKLAQLKPGDFVRFKQINIKKAQKIYIKEKNKIDKIKKIVSIKGQKYNIYINGKKHSVTVQEIK